MAHSLLPPSQAHIWGPFNGCTGWAVQSSTAPKRPETDAIRESIEARSLGLNMIRSYQHAGIDFPVREAYGDKVYRAACIWADNVRDVMRETRTFGGDNIQLDYYIECPSISEYTNGKIDCFIYDPKSHTLYVWLFKNGHTPIDAKGNLRGVCYVSGLFDKLDINGKGDQHTIVDFRVIQPNSYDRAGPIKSWRFVGYELRNHVNILHDSALRALGVSVNCKAGTYCTTCEARYNCEASYKAAVSIFEATALPMVDDMPPEELSQRYRMIKYAVPFLKALDTAYSQQVESRLRANKPVPGFTAEPKYGRLDWIIPKDEVIKLGEFMGKKLHKTTPITPLQATKAGIDEATISLYAERKQSGWEIIPVEESINRAKEILS